MMRSFSSGEADEATDKNLIAGGSKKHMMEVALFGNRALTFSVTHG